MVKSEIRLAGNVPVLCINDIPVPGLAYITYFRQDACYKQFADAGYKLFSTPLYFGDQTINERSGIAPFEPGIFSKKGIADFSIADRQIRQILELVPDACIFPRVNMSVPRWWETENPEECNDTGVKDGPRRSCFSSGKWYDFTLEMLRQFVDHIEKSSFADHVIGYMLSDGNTEEWFSFDGLGSIGPAARKKFSGAAEESNPAFRRYLSTVCAEVICRFAAEVKKMTSHRKVVGSFYGYTFEVPTWKSNHHALRTVLNSPDVDFICSPASYSARKMPGTDWPNMLPIDSVQAAGKLYFMENDTRTHLSRFLKDCHPGACPEHTYEQAVWLGPETEELTIGQLRMNFARQLADGHASWWFDMWGGWFDSPAMMREFAEFMQIEKMFMKDKIRKTPAECALWIDETAFALTEPELEHGLAKQSRFNVGQSGVPFDFYEIGDFAERGVFYKAHIFVIHADTPAVINAIDKCRDNNIPVLILRPDAVPSADGIREFCRKAGVHVYCDSGDAVHIAPHFAAIHAASDGEKRLLFPQTFRIVPLLDEGTTMDSSEIRLTMKQGETRLFRLDCFDKEKI